MPYAFKFVWAPLIDRLPVPPFTTRLGRRRGWTVLTQLVLMAAVVGLGSTDPARDPGLTALVALVVAFCSASQDVVIDAYRVEILEERQYGAGAAMIVLGYRIGMLVAGAGALYLASYVGWFEVYAAMAALVTVGVAAILLNPEPKGPPAGAAGEEERRIRGWLARRPHLAGRRAAVAAWLYGAVVSPFADFVARRGWVLILLFIVLYKFGDSLAGVMANPFYIELGFTKIEIANVSKLFGLGATLVGGLIGGALVNQAGILRSLLVCGVLQMLSNLLFAVQAVVGHSVPMLVLTIAAENVSGGMGTAAFVAYLSRLCNVAYTATQYALLSSLMSFARTLLASSGGWLADRLDWVSFFVATTGAAMPGLLLLLWLMRRYPPGPPRGLRTARVTPPAARAAPSGTPTA